MNISSSTYAQRVAAVAAFLRKHKRMPSYSEMAELFKVKSKNAVAKVVDDMLEHGVVRKDDTGRLVPYNLLRGVKILGTIAAGFPSPAEEELADAISLDDYLIERPTASFMLQVSGDSMINAGIHPGDMVIIERGRPPKNDDIVVAEVDHEWTLKRFHKTGRKVLLLAENPNYPTPIEATEELLIHGVVRSVIRKYT